MEPVTHLLTGACLGRSGFNRCTAYATLAMTLAAEAPDLDVLWAFKGPVAAFEHHRGVTHTLLGAPFVALIVTGFCWLLHRFRRKPSGATPRLAPRWGALWLLALLAALSHIFLDWTNNYGIRPFFPFNPRWYSLDLVFIFEPVLFACLLLGLVVPGILGLADREISSRRPAFHGRGWAIAALTLSGVLWGLRAVEHQRALDLIRNSAFGHPAPTAAGAEPLLRAAAEPYPINPFRWFAVIETPHTFQTAPLTTRGAADDGAIDTDSASVIFKPPVTLATLAAKRSWLGRVYLDWSQYPVVIDRGHSNLVPSEDLQPNPQDTAVQFRDLRFGYSVFSRSQQPGANDPAANALAGWVLVSPSRTIDAMVMSGRAQD